MGGGPGQLSSGMGRVVAPVYDQTVHLVQSPASAAGFFHRLSLGISTDGNVSVAYVRTGKSLSSDKPFTLNVSDCGQSQRVQTGRSRAPLAGIHVATISSIRTRFRNVHRANFPTSLENVGFTAMRKTASDMHVWYSVTSHHAYVSTRCCPFSVIYCHNLRVSLMVVRTSFFY